MMAFQPGDVINIARVAWDVYNYGWTNELRASTLYSQFGTEFRHLAENLDVLASVVGKAQESLRNHGVRNSGQIRWDPKSLLDIVGDFQATLRECRQLLHDNKKYNAGSNNPLRNIEWNVLVQPSADRLKGRIQLHNTRIQNVLKPFEIDLLTRIHQDLAQRIGAVHDDVRQVHSELRSLIGVLVPDLKTALDQQDALQIRLLTVPPEIEQELEAVFRLHPAWLDEQCPPLRDIADAFIMNLEQSTKRFKPGLTVSERIPPVDQYLNLLKCVFLLKKMEVSEDLVNASSQSHWPSYVKELKERLSHECDQFDRGMVAPSNPLADIDEDALHFWIEEAPGDLIDTVTTKVMMEELMEIPLFTNSRNVTKRLRLMRHAGTHDKKYRLVVSATEKQTSGRPRQQKEVVDFDVTTATLNPLYALPSDTPMAPYEIILQANNKIHRLAFSTLEDAFLFQQGITGFKVVDNYSEPRAKVSFVVEGQGGSILEDASAQLWVQRRLGGSLVPENSDSPSPIDTPPSPIPISGGPRIMSSTYSGHDAISEFGPSHQFGSPENMTAELGSMNLSSSPGKMSTGPGMHSRSPITPPMASTSRFPTSPNRSHTLGVSAPLSTSPGQDSTSSSSFMSKFKRRKKPSQDKPRAFSVSSTTTTATSVTVGSNSSSTSDTTVTVEGAGHPRTALIHTMPLKPMLVLFTQDTKTDHRAIVAVSIDEKTIPNPQRCWCQQGAGPDGQPCKITVLEQSGGEKVLETKRLYSSTGQWDLLPLCANRRKEKKGFAGADWRGLNRVSILFPEVQARYAFGGGFCTCRRQTEGEVMECIRNGHVGLLGQVRVHYRNQARRWYEGRYGAAVHVSNLSLAGGPGDPVWRRP